MDAAGSPLRTSSALDAASLGLALVVAQQRGDTDGVRALLRHATPAEVTWGLGQLAVLLLPLGTAEHECRLPDFARGDGRRLTLRCEDRAGVAPELAPALTFLVAAAAGDVRRAEAELADLRGRWFPDPAGRPGLPAVGDRYRRLVEDGLLVVGSWLLARLARHHGCGEAEIAARLQQWVLRLRGGHTVLELTTRSVAEVELPLSCRTCPAPAHAL